jgi:hypothetical protein
VLHRQLLLFLFFPSLSYFPELFKRSFRLQYHKIIIFLTDIVAQTYKSIDFLRLPRPQGERRKSIFSPWGWGKKIDFQAIWDL